MIAKKDRIKSPSQYAKQLGEAIIEKDLYRELILLHYVYQLIINSYCLYYNVPKYTGVDR
jgi:hypothetical protein